MCYLRLKYVNVIFFSCYLPVAYAIFLVVFDFSPRARGRDQCRMASNVRGLQGIFVLNRDEAILDIR